MCEFFSSIAVSPLMTLGTYAGNHDKGAIDRFNGDGGDARA